MVVEIPARVDRSGVHPYAIGELPRPVLPYIIHKTASLGLIVEAAMEGSRQKAIQALVNDPYTDDVSAAVNVVNELIDAEISFLPNFQ